VDLQATLSEYAAEVASLSATAAGEHLSVAERAFQVGSVTFIPVYHTIITHS
jgi:hypothetical protein